MQGRLYCSGLLLGLVFFLVIDDPYVSYIVFQNLPGAPSSSHLGRYELHTLKLS